MDFGKRLASRRQEQGLTQHELAERIGISRGALSLYELGKRNPDFETLEKIAQILNVSTDYLLGRTDDPRPIDQINEENKQRITEALKNDPEAAELLEFWEELKEREDLKLLFKQVRPLSDESIRRVIRIIKAIEDEESMEP